MSEAIKNTEFKAFEEEYGYLVKRTTVWDDMEAAFAAFNALGHENFMKKVEENIDFNDFCAEFYPTLREFYNICSAGMVEEFERMRAKDWSFAEYGAYLQKHTGAGKRRRA
jgi:hypothetical protein